MLVSVGLPLLVRCWRGECGGGVESVRQAGPRKARLVLVVQVAAARRGSTARLLQVEIRSLISQRDGGSH